MLARAMFALAVMTGALASPVNAAVSAPPLSAEGRVNAIQRFGPRLLVTGSFTSIGPVVGSALALSTESGARDPRFPLVDGQVSDAIADGHGGWYLGGAFSEVGGVPARNVVHVLAGGSVDPAFRAGVGAFVTALALGDGRLYAGEYSFGESSVVALSPETGRALPGFRPRFKDNVTELELAGDRLFVGASDVTAVDPLTGRRTTGFACSDCADERRVTALAHDDKRLFVGSVTRGVYAVDLATGRRDTAFHPSPNRVEGGAEDRGALVFVLDGTRLLAGGRGLRLGGPSTRLVALDTTTGAADPSFGAGASAPIHDMLLAGDRLLAAGGDTDAASLAVLDRATGAAVRTLDPGVDGPIDALAAASAGRVLAGGRFSVAGAQRTDGMAVVDAASGRLEPGFAFRGSTDATDLTLTGGALVGASTDFSHYGSAHSRIVTRFRAWSASTGARLAGFRTPPIVSNSTRDDYGDAPGSGIPWTAGGGRVFAVRAHRAVHVGANDVVVMSAATGRRLTTWRVPFPGYVTQLTFTGDRVYVAGSFKRTRPNGTPANLATLALDARTGAFIDSFDAHTHGPVYGVTPRPGGLYLTGIFDRASQARRDGIAAVYANTGAVDTSFAPRLNRSGEHEIAFGAATLLSPSALLLTRGYRGDLLVDPYTGRVISRPTAPDGTRLDVLTAVGSRIYAGYVPPSPLYDQSPHTLLTFLGR